ncbi:GDCCVxC domain-containing (seleno)protein [Bradyrhizobium sp.]|uniref:GDCCVxC domain-containing (seleno)protein n=1 Tax=Bradyrhizobium sp. TaxID=376 RepID=UPI003C674244
MIACPGCGYRSTEIRRTDTCQFFYHCKGRGERLKPLKGDCCVFCSYGTLSCPPLQSPNRTGLERIA